MNISVPHSTSNRGLSATSQAPSELGDSKKFLEKRDASRLSQKPLVQGTENCPQCGSANFSTGAGRKPNEISLRCSECKAFAGYKNIEKLLKLQKLRRQKKTTDCYQLLEDCGLTGDEAVFILSAVGGVK